MLEPLTVDRALVKTLQRTSATPTFAGKPIVPVPGPAPHSQTPSWPARQMYKASVKASLHYQKNGRRMSELAMRKVAKNLWIKFVVETNTPRPYNVYWKVVNTGAEAQAQNQLRGNIFEGEPRSDVQWEHTKYTGTHWVEAYIVKDGYLVASSPKKFVLVR